MKIVWKNVVYSHQWLACWLFGHRWGELQPTIVEGAEIPGYGCTRCEQAFKLAP